jgi:hypothetical protein
MEPEGENRRDRLARFNLERLNIAPKQGGRAGLERAIDRWERFMAGSGWEKGFFAAAVLLIAGLAIAAIFMLASNAFGGGGGRKPVTAGALPSTATLVPPRPTPTAIVIAVPTLSTAAPANRQDCNAISGTGYKSDAERLFFEQNCVTPTAEPSNPGNGDGGPPTEPPTEPPQPQPTEGPVVVDAGNAAEFAVYWIEHNASQAYTDVGPCNVVQSGSHWVVTCNANVAGCQGSVCATTISVCVFPDPLEVRPANQC